MLYLKSIGEILNKNFYIPSYQRGYRWDKQQVLELLNDIYEFSKKKSKEESEFYCLQPIVLLKDEENDYYKVIDGQQRLTTILLILKLFLSSRHFSNFPISNNLTALANSRPLTS